MGSRKEVEGERGRRQKCKIFVSLCKCLGWSEYCHRQVSPLDERSNKQTPPPQCFSSSRNDTKPRSQYCTSLVCVAYTCRENRKHVTTASEIIVPVRAFEVTLSGDMWKFSGREGCVTRQAWEYTYKHRKTTCPVRDIKPQQSVGGELNAEGQERAPCAPPPQESSIVTVW